MPTVRTMVNTGLYKNVDEEELVDKSFELVNGYLDDLGATKKIPGFSLEAELTTTPKKMGYGVDGLYYWEDKDIIIACSYGYVYSLKPRGNSYSLAQIGSSGKILAGNQVTFTTDGTYVYMANGGKIAYTDGESILENITDENAPKNCTHIVFIDGYIMGNEENTQIFKWSDLLSPTSWNGLNFAQAVGDGDNINAIIVQNREVYLFGRKSIEIWENDGTTPFSRITGGFLQVGCLAPYSIIAFEGKLYWLNDKRHFIEFNGRDYKVISTAIDKNIASMSNVDDCIGYRVDINGKPFLLWTFPKEDKTYLYNITLSYNYDPKAFNQSASDLGSWSMLGEWISLNNGYSRYRANAVCFDSKRGNLFIGDYETGKIFKVSSNDYKYDDKEIRLYRKTGHIDYGSLKAKRNRETRIRIKSGYQDIGRQPVLMFNIRDNNFKNFKQYEFLLGGIGQTNLIKRMFRTGMFRTRQYEFIVTDPIDTLYLTVEEDLDLMMR